MSGIFPRRLELLRLAAKEKQSSVHASIGEACRRLQVLRIEADCEEVPANLVRFAKHLGISSLRETILPMKGRLLAERDGFVVEVSSELPAFERRFTVAHELAHVIVEGAELRKLSRSERGKQLQAHSNRITEQLCDAVATELLLPYDWVKRKAMVEGPRIDLVIDMARHSETSAEIVADRIIELGAWDCRFFWWTNRRGYFRAIRSAPFLDDIFLAFVGPGNQRKTLLRRATEEGHVVIGHDVIRFRDEAITGPFQCVRVSNNQIFSLLETGPHSGR